MPATFDLGRFTQAQDPVLAQVRSELAAGRKRTHWMWFVFPQLAGLGHSPMAQRYALDSIEEARAFLAHPVLGPRLLDCTGLVNRSASQTAHAIFGSPDDLKFHSSMTLFGRANPAEPQFKQALDTYFGSAADPRTLALLGERP